MEQARLSYNLPTPHVVARDPNRGVILLEGLGAMGVGEMWFREAADHRKYPGYEDAETVDTADSPLFGLS